MTPADRDHELVKRILGNEPDAFRELIRIYRKLVWHVVSGMVRNAADREELGQEVFVKVYRSLPSFRFDAKLATWIARIAHNACISFRKKHRLPLYDDLPEGESGISSAAQAGPIGESRVLECMHREIARLPVRYRVPLLLYHLDDMSHREIAAVTGMAVGTVKSYLFRARKLLKERLQKRYTKEDLWE